MAIRAVVTVTGVKVVVAKHAKTAKAFRDFTAVLNAAGLKLQDRARKRLLQRPTAQTAKARASATDALADSIHTVVDRSKQRATTATAVVYAKIQQEGGEIVAKPPRKALAIPMTIPLARDHAKPSQFPRSEFQFMGIFRGKVLGALKFAPRNEEEEKIPLRDRETAFLLVRSVTIKGQRYLFKTPADARFVRALILRSFVKSRE